ncbi:MAG: VCBS repeat-containing protein [Acidobacteriota bacterium]|nr:VCBS repeat-containing protein [Acidobacteriota bacterium]
MKKRWKIRLIVLAVLIVGVGGLVWLQVDRLEHRALRHAESGRSAGKLLGSLAEALAEGRMEAVLDCYTPDYAESGPAAWETTSRYETDGLVVAGWVASTRKTAGREGVAGRYRALLEPVERFEHVKVKLDRVLADRGERGLDIRSILWLRGRHKDGTGFESKARFEMTLVPGEQGHRIASQQLISGDTVSGPGTGFADVAANVGLDFEARANPMYETEAWRPDVFGIFKYSSAGLSAADYDGDGWYDLFLGDGARMALYRNLGSEGFKEVTAEAGLPVDQPGINVGLFADFDNDGDQDLLLGGLTVSGGLYRNDGNGSFSRESLTLDPLVTVAGAADYDLDGDLDIYLGRYLDPREDLPTTLFYTRNSAGNQLLRNDGNLQFTDVTEAAGVREGGLTLGVAWGDYDRDGNPDIYVANDFGRNAMLRNNGDGSFTDTTLETNTMDFGFGMSATFADADNDGDLDIYVSNVASSQRWYGQSATLYKYLMNSFRQGTMMEDLPLYREIVKFAGDNWRNYGDGMVKGNSLLLNDGKGRFADVAESAGANPLGWYWGSTLFDYDNDGLQDIYAGNGWITGHVTDDL